MALWLTALQAIPWDQVLSNAPKMISAAKKLLSRSKDAEPAPFLPDGVVIDEQHRLAYLENIVRENRQELRSLHERMEEAALLLQSLSDQNAALVEAIELLRERSKALLMAAVVAMAGVGVLAGYLLAG